MSGQFRPNLTRNPPNQFKFLQTSSIQSKSSRKSQYFLIYSSPFTKLPLPNWLHYICTCIYPLKYFKVFHPSTINLEHTQHQMSPNNLVIRLARFGRKHQPLYNIVVANKRSARDSLPVEVLGTYNPVPIPAGPSDLDKKPFKHIELDFHRARYWLGVGAETSDRVSFLFKRAGLVPELWPKPAKLSQHVAKPISEEIQEVLEEPREFYRPRD